MFRSILPNQTKIRCGIGIQKILRRAYNLQSHSVVDHHKRIFAASQKERDTVSRHVQENLYSHFASDRLHTLGYQVNLDLNNSSYGKFLDFHMNNIGDPYGEHPAPVANSVSIERHLVHIVAALANLPDNETWGYCVPGSTIGNLQGMWMARQRLPHSTFIMSEASHYSVAKTMNMLRYDSSMTIKVDRLGRMDMVDLKKQLGEKQPESVAIVLTNGVTMTGAYDDIEEATKILSEFYNGDSTKFHVHVDAALGGLLTPFLPDVPVLDFRNPTVSTMTTSFHKQLGSPIPCGAFLSRNSIKSMTVDTQPDIDYVLTKDVTVTGSRDGFSVLNAWLRMMNYGYEGLQRLALHNSARARKFVEDLQAAGINAHCAPDGLCVWFPKPSNEIVTKYHMSCGKIGSFDEIAHIYMMGHVSDKVLAEIITDMTGN